MLDPNLTAVVGTPNDHVTHWGITRKYTDGRGREKWEHLEAPDASGVYLKRWPLESLNLAMVQKTWGAGEYRVHWMTLDPENPEPSQRTMSQGNGSPFRVESPAPEEPAPSLAASPAPAAPLSTPAGSDPLSFALHFAEMQDRRLMQTLTSLRAAAPGLAHAGGAAGDPAVADLRAELAGMRARMEADAERRKLEDEYRAKLAEKEREIERLRARRDREDDEGPFEPGAPILEQLAPLVLNWAAKNVDAAAKLLPLIMGTAAGEAPSSPAPALPAPARPAAAPARPVVTPIVRPVVAPAPAPAPEPEPDPVSPSSEAWTPIGAAAP
jgi:hypothetical protein